MMHIPVISEIKHEHFH